MGRARNRITAPLAGLARLCAAGAALTLTAAAAPLETVASAGELSITDSEFDTALLVRHGGTTVGEDALASLAERLVIDELADRQGIEIGERALAEAWAQLDTQARARGHEGGLRSELDRAGVDLEEFKARLRQQLALERLVRLDLGTPPERPCPPEQQQLWLDAQLAERGIERLPRPWKDGLAANVGTTIAITESEWASSVRTLVPSEELRELAFQLLLAKAVERRLPDLSEAGRDAAVAAEIERRRAAAEADPAFQGVPFEELLSAQGLSLDLLARDPAVRIAGLSTWFVDRAQGAEGLRATYEAERDWFEDRFGEAVRTRILYLVGAPERGPLTPRSFADAEQVLRELAEDIDSEADFERLARTQSEDPLSRERGGDLGFVVPAAESVPRALRDEIFLQRGAGRTGLVGPVRLDNGAALLWLGAVRPSPPWEEMQGYVHRELRRRFLVETLSPSTITTIFDAPAPPR
jgi:hypothetical protein